MSGYQLAHHGVKGMRWGIRRYQPYPKGKHGKFLGQDRDEDIRIKKDTEAYRVQAKKDMTGDGSTYVSFDKLSNVKYIRASLDPDMGVAVDTYLEPNGNNNRPYNVTLKLRKDIILPSYQKTMDAFIDTVSEVGVKQVAKDMGTVQQGKEFVKAYKHKKVNEKLDESYLSFTGQLMRNTEARRVFFKILQDQGYNAIIDEWDYKFGNGSSETPVIIFNKNDALKQTKSNPITEKDADYFNALVYNLYIPDLKTKQKWEKYAGKKLSGDDF